ncbi:MAG: hypothetical protein ABH891_05260 [Candidatus Omnitrophota bacterium]
MKPGKRSNKLPPFVPLPREMLKLPEWRSGLSNSAKVLYIHLKHKFVGHNNGEICLHYSEVRDILAPGTISRAFKELEEKDWIRREQQIGGKYRFTVYYRLTGKHDNAVHRFKF